MKKNKLIKNVIKATESQQVLQPNFFVTAEAYIGPNTYPKPLNIL